MKTLTTILLLTLATLAYAQREPTTNPNNASASLSLYPPGVTGTDTVLSGGKLIVTVSYTVVTAGDYTPFGGGVSSGGEVFAATTQGPLTAGLEVTTPKVAGRIKSPDYFDFYEANPPFGAVAGGCLPPAAFENIFTANGTLPACTNRDFDLNGNQLFIHTTAANPDIVSSFEQKAGRITMIARNCESNSDGFSWSLNGCDFQISQPAKGQPNCGSNLHLVISKGQWDLDLCGGAREFNVSVQSKDLIKLNAGGVDLGDFCSPVYIEGSTLTYCVAGAIYTFSATSIRGCSPIISFGSSGACNVSVMEFGDINDVVTIEGLPYPPAAGCGTLNNIVMFTPDGTTLGDSLMIQTASNTIQFPVSDGACGNPGNCLPSIVFKGIAAACDPNSIGILENGIGQLILRHQNNAVLTFTTVAQGNKLIVSNRNLTANQGLTVAGGNILLLGGEIQHGTIASINKIIVKRDNVTAERIQQWTDAAGSLAIDASMTTDFTPVRDSVAGKFINADQLRALERSSDPSAPSEGSFVIWMSDGTGSGDDGDILISIQAGAVTKTTTLVDFSALP